MYVLDCSTCEFWKKCLEEGKSTFELCIFIPEEEREQPEEVEEE